MAERQRDFALLGAAGYIAPRHMRAIRETGNRLLVACDPKESVGLLDSFAPEAHFFTEFECFEDFAYCLRRRGAGLDYLSICSPNHLHQAHVSAGLRLGCDIICEKPLVLDCLALDELARLEAESGQRINAILQLRLHPAIQELREILAGKMRGRGPGGRHEVELTYITSRGQWYSQTWKADPRKSGGLAMNIGVHFFDMLHFLFGHRQASELHLAEPRRMAGCLEYERARVRWFLSIGAEDLPLERPAGQQTYRSITINGRAVEFSGGFTDLHTESYASILAGKGFSIADVRPAIETVETINRSPVVVGDLEGRHPLVKRDWLGSEAVPA